MVFSSLLFLFRFLPAVLILYYIAPRKLRNVILLLFSLFFYAWGEPKYVFLMLFTITMDFFIGKGIDKAKKEGNQKKAKRFLMISILVDLSILGFFKYADFLIGTVNTLTGAGIPLLGIPLPIGISFFTFQTMSYTIDVYKGSTEVQKNWIKYGTYVSMFPQLIAGPIVQYKTIAEQMEHRKENTSDFSEGIHRFMIGLGKKVLIANNIGALWDAIAVLPVDGLAAGTAWLGALAYTFQIYFDFSGYSDIAIGTAKLFNINLIKNFDSPYFSASVKEFWRRWHISLSNWFRDYLYIPLGGNRRGFIVSKLNVIFVFLVSGLWHGAGWNYVVWGGMHGVAQLFNNRKVNKNVKHNAVWWLKVLLTFLFVTLTWMVFRLGITETVNMLSGLSWRWCSFSESMDRIVDNTLLTHAKLALVAVCAVLLMVYDYFSLKRDLLNEFGRLNVVVRCAVYVFMIMFILFEMPLVVTSRFIYFQF